jgi:hypothetical protein
LLSSRERDGGPDSRSEKGLGKLKLPFDVYSEERRKKPCSWQFCENFKQED